MKDLLRKMLSAMFQPRPALAGGLELSNEHYESGLISLYKNPAGPPLDMSLLPRYVVSEASDSFAASAARPLAAHRAIAPKLKIATGQLFTLEFAVDGEMKDGTYFQARRTIYGPRNIYTLTHGKN